MASIVLSPATIELLKVSAQVNQNLLIRENSNTVWSMSTGKNLVFKAEASETFPTEFAIYNLNELLASLSLFKAPELNFSENQLIISESGQKKGTKLRYVASAKQILIYPSKQSPEPQWDCTFKMSASILGQIQKAAGVLGAPDMSVVADDTGITIQVYDKKNPNANMLAIPVSDEPQANSFTADVKIENFKLLPEDYDVSVSVKGLLKVSNAKLSLFVALETSSKLS